MVAVMPGASIVRLPPISVTLPLVPEAALMDVTEMLLVVGVVRLIEPFDVLALTTVRLLASFTRRFPAAVMVLFKPATFVLSVALLRDVVESTLAVMRPLELIEPAGARSVTFPEEPALIATAFVRFPAARLSVMLPLLA